MPKFNVLVLLSLFTHVISNRLNLKHIHCAVMSEWLMHLTNFLIAAGLPIAMSICVTLVM